MGAFYRLFAFFSVLMVLSSQGYASQVLGRMVAYRSDTRGVVYPFVSDRKYTLEDKSLIRIAGAALVAEKGTVLEAIPNEGETKFVVEKGEIIFRINPQMRRVVFGTQFGVVSSPEVVPVGTGFITGRIAVGGEGSLVEVYEGSLMAEARDGVRTVAQGQSFYLAQAEIEKEASEEGLEALLNKVGTASSPLDPEGLVLIDGKQFTAVAVGDDLKPIDGANLPTGTEVRVLGISGGTLLVQPLRRDMIAESLVPNRSPNEVAGIIVGSLGGAGALITALILGSQAGDGEGSPVLPPQP